MFISTVIVLGLAVVGLAVPQPEKRARAQVVTRCTVPNTAALTFDDGPYLYMYDVSKILKAANAKGTFFFIGCIYSEDNVKRVKYAYDNGHQLASHTWAHKDLSTLTWDQIHDEMWRVEQALQRITGAYPAFMRPPYGNYNNLVLDASGIRGQSVVIWDFDSEDSRGASVARQKSLYNEIANRRPSTILALNHEVHASSVFETLPYAIQRLQSAGYKLVTLAECLGKPAYQSVGAPSPRTADWKC
ncbi:carbohydrate esterase family 4 protein [Collybia nuda]|uniref:Carbohydrate esterase family 4 protein n=1 Tax=Collybia nuda TaxID=64659 RepID=A0A9P5XWQ8_9AGAR|nr:carbohydrate esterase family 4 protein [Collybia nuda]